MSFASRCPRPALRVEPLEDRRVPALNFLFDYSFDTYGFFSDPARRAVLEQAAADLGAPIGATPAAIVPGGSNLWEAVFTDPWTGRTARVPNRTVPAGTLLVFVGGMVAEGSQTAEGGPGGYTVRGSSTFQNLVATRGLGGFAPWGGSVAFDVTEDWYVSLDPSGIQSGQVDLYSVAVHELGHVLGAGTSDAWSALTQNGHFLGPASVAAYGGPVPLDPDDSHFAQGTNINGIPASLQPVLETGRLSFSTLDYAALTDLGWQAGDGSITQPISRSAALRAGPVGAGRLTAVSGPTDGSVRLYMPGSDGRLVAAGDSFRPFDNFGGPVRTATADVNGDTVADLIVGTGPGGGSHVRILDGRTLDDMVDPFEVFESSFRGGVFLAAGDLDGDGRDEVVVTPDQGGGPRVRVFTFDPGAATVVADFFGIDDPNFRGGARSAVGDLNGDGRPDLVVAAGFGGGPRVALFDGTTLTRSSPRRLVGDFFAFEHTLRNGVYATVGDLDGDGRGDPTFGAGPGGGPRVLTLNADTLLGSGPEAALAGPLVNTFAGDPNLRGGVRVAAKDLDPDGSTALVTGNGAGGDLLVLQLTPVGVSTGASLNPFGNVTLDGIYVG